MFNKRAKSHTRDAHRDAQTRMCFVHIEGIKFATSLQAWWAPATCAAIKFQRMETNPNNDTQLAKLSKDGPRIMHGHHYSLCVPGAILQPYTNRANPKWENPPTSAHQTVCLSEARSKCNSDLADQNPHVCTHLYSSSC